MRYNKKTDAFCIEMFDYDMNCDDDMCISFLYNLYKKIIHKYKIGDVWGSNIYDITLSFSYTGSSGRDHYEHGYWEREGDEAYMLSLYKSFYNGTIVRNIHVIQGFHNIFTLFKQMLNDELWEI